MNKDNRVDCFLSDDNYDFLIELQAEYRKRKKGRGLSKLVDLLLTEQRLKLTGQDFESRFKQ